MDRMIIGPLIPAVGVGRFVYVRRKLKRFYERALGSGRWVIGSGSQEIK